MQPTGPLGDAEYAKLLAFRVGLRRFLSWSEEQAVAVGLTPTQHQLLLAIRGHTDPRGPSVGALADTLGTRHHSAVQLLDRAEQLDLVTRNREDDQDRRIVRLALTEAGEQKLAQLSATHLQELRRLAPLIHTLVELAQGSGTGFGADSPEGRTSESAGPLVPGDFGGLLPNGKAGARATQRTEPGSAENDATGGRT